MNKTKRNSNNKFPKNKGKSGTNKRQSRPNFNNSKAKEEYPNVSGTQFSKDDPRCSLNDVSWYSRYPELLASAARIPTPYKPGMVVTADTDTQYKGTLKFEVPGVMSLWYSPTIGKSIDSQSPATIMSKELWARIRSKFSASLDADAPDIIMYALELDQIHAYLAWLKRLYRTISLWSPQNRDFPEVVMYAMGLGKQAPKLLQANQMAFFGRLNTTIRQANKFLVPEDMDLYHRHRWMNENVYGDEDSPMAQMYVFNPLTYWLINTTDATSLTATVVPTFVTAENSYAALEDALFKPVDDMIAAMSNWEDAYTINGYIERAFEGTQFYGTALINYDEKLAPVYSPEVLSQIENIHVVDLGALSTWNVTQDPNTNNIISVPWGSTNGSTPPLLNLHMDVPTAADITVATRLTAWADAGDHGKVVCGTEVVNAISVHYHMDADGSTTDTPWEISSGKKLMYGKSIIYDTVWTVADPSGMNTVLRNLSYLASWRHHPVMVLWFKNASGDTNCKALPIVDMHNITLLRTTDLAELHRVCIYSEFNCFRAQ